MSKKELDAHVNDCVKKYAYKDEDCKVPLQGRQLENFKVAIREAAPHAVAYRGQNILGVV